MMKIVSKPAFGLTLLAAAALLLAGCTNFKSHSEVEALNEAKAVGSPFTQSLASEYRLLANFNQDKDMDYPDALHFARKGLAAVSGEVVLPEPISDWNLRPPHIDELTPARAGLIAALDAGAREQNPQLAAEAQTRFDCWIEQQEEQWDNPNVPCKAQFFNALNALGGVPQAPAPAPMADVMAPITPMAPPSTPMAPEDAKYLVFFDFDSSTVDQGGQSVVDSIAAEVAKQNIRSVVVTGHADTSGSTMYNQRLGMKRANNVKDALVARGINAQLLQVESRGESELMVATPDGVREPANRRVEVTFVK
jgi:OmpA-OmpF porin, OOP family